jgi:hypothetical protein
MGTTSTSDIAWAGRPSADERALYDGAAEPPRRRARANQAAKRKLWISCFLDSSSADCELRFAPKRCRKSLPSMNPFATEPGSTRSP